LGGVKDRSAVIRRSVKTESTLERFRNVSYFFVA
jgi:hypothetical protein